MHPSLILITRTHTYHTIATFSSFYSHILCRLVTKVKNKKKGCLHATPLLQPRIDIHSVPRYRRKREKPRKKKRREPQDSLTSNTLSPTRCMWTAARDNNKIINQAGSL